MTTDSSTKVSLAGVTLITPPSTCARSRLYRSASRVVRVKLADASSSPSETVTVMVVAPVLSLLGTMYRCRSPSSVITKRILFCATTLWSLLATLNARVAPGSGSLASTTIGPISRMFTPCWSVMAAITGGSGSSIISSM